MNITVGTGNIDQNETMFLVTCSSSSDCEPESDIKLFVYRNEIEGPVRHPDFKCQKKFEQGLWFVSCNGTVSKEAIVDFDKIGCRLHLKNQTEKEFFEKVISKDVFLCGSSAGMFENSQLISIYKDSLENKIQA